MLPAETFYSLKRTLLGMMPLSADALHVHIGLLLFLLCAALARGERRFTIAFLATLAICLVGESLDLAYDLLAGNRLRWRNGIKDIVGTTLWPGVWALSWSRLMKRGASFLGTDQHPGYAVQGDVAHKRNPATHVACPINPSPGGSPDESW